MYKRTSILFVFLIVGILVSCSPVESRNEITDDISKSIDIQKQANPKEISQEDVTYLCSKLNEIKVIPPDPGEKADDPIYDGLIKKGKEAIPCLIDKITDTTLMDDPRTAPKVKSFRVGDAAVFMLLYIRKETWQPDEMFPPEYAKTWASQGVYAYFAYVEKTEDRKNFQSWWKDWMKKNLNK